MSLGHIPREALAIEDVARRLSEWGAPKREPDATPEMRAKGKAFEQTFASPSGKEALETLLDMTLRRPIGPDANMDERRGQNAIVLAILDYINIGKEEAIHDRASRNSPSASEQSDINTSPFIAIG